METQTEIVCPQCGVVFVITPHTARRYCSRKCYEVARSSGVFLRGTRGPDWTLGRHEYVKPCGICGEEFSARHPRTLYCDACKPEAKRRRGHKNVLRKQDKIAARPLVPCAWCGTPIHPRRGRKFCSIPCNLRAGKARRRARDRDVFIEDVSLAVLRERDGGTCRLCARPVDFSLAWPNPASPSIDHIVALARGGVHSYQNTQLAHLLCNWLKGCKDGVPEEKLSLIKGAL
jgi:5-methylcytosine-specific restriction endonuclease McrA